MKVKRIIEIEEDTLKFVQELTEVIIPARSGKTLQKNVIEAIKFSKSYDDSGDCISRDELRKTILSMDFDFGDYYDNTREIKERVCEKIDSAQAVDLWQMRQEATENALKKAEVLYGRPKGEWKVRPHIDADGDCDGYELYCSKCGDVKVMLLNRSFTLEEATERLKSEHKNFCFECGADMRGEEDVSST